MAGGGAGLGGLDLAAYAGLHPLARRWAREGGR